MWLRIILFAIGLILAVAVVAFGEHVGIAHRDLKIGLAVLFLCPVPIMLIAGVIQRRRAKASLERAAQPAADPEVVADIDRKIAKLDQVLAASKAAGEASERIACRVLVIGPAGSGKSSAIRQSRLELPFATTKDPSDRVEIFLTRQGALFDVPGALMEDGGPHHAAWLHLLRRAGRGRFLPVDAVVVVVAVEALLAPSSDREELAHRMRRRLIEALEITGWRMPAYVCFTKCDRIVGFVESFGVLPSAERARALGALLEDPDPNGVRAALDGLIEHLRASARGRLSHLDAPLRPSSFLVPEQIAELAPHAEAFVRRLLEPSVAGDSVRVAGVYFGSARQERAALDPAGRGVRERIGVSGGGASGGVEGASSFFLHELFARVVLHGAIAPSRSVPGTKRRTRSVVAGAGAAGLASLFVLGASVFSYSRNSGLVESSVVAAKGLKRPGEIAESDYERLQSMLAAAEALDRLETWEQGAPISHRFGFYAGSDVVIPLRRAFDRPMQELFVDRVGRELESMLQDATGSGNVADDYDVLKAYLELTRELGRLDADFVTPVLVEIWKRRLDETARGEPALLSRLAAVYVREVGRGVLRWPTPSDTLISDARASLERRNGEYERMIARARKEAGRPMTLTEIVGGKVPDALRAGREVDRIYTLEGWRKVRGSFEESPEGAEHWVLGKHGSDDAMVASAEKTYLGLFAAEWHRFLRDLSIREARSLPDARLVLDELLARPSILELLVRGVKAQMKFPTASEEGLSAATKLKGKAGVLATKLSAKKPAGEKNSVQLDFQPLFDLADPSADASGAVPVSGMSQILEKLAAVAKAMEKLEGKEDADTRELEAAVGEARSAIDTVLRGVPEPIAAVLKPLLLDTLRGVTAEAETERFARTEKSFASKVCAVYEETLAGRYPFAGGAEDDALLDAVTAFLGPTGAAWTYFDTSLAQDLTRIGDGIEAKNEARVSKGIVAFYRRASVVRAALFPGNAAALDREVQVRPQGITAAPGNRITGVTLEIGGERRTYRFGPPETWSFQWPTKVGRARLSLEGLSEPIEAWGDWALFRLADKASSKPLAGGWVELRFSFKNGEVQVPLQLRMGGTANPLLERPRFGLTCR
jgi:type VI secretion system protein ImpL